MVFWSDVFLIVQNSIHYMYKQILFLSFVQAGQVLVPEGCDVSMVCNEKTKKFDSTPLKCHTDASCKFQDGIYGCHCNYMYRGDGQNCTCKWSTNVLYTGKCLPHFILLLLPLSDKF